MPASGHMLLLPGVALKSTEGLLLQILKEDDSNWPLADRVGTQELEIILGSEHISFKTTKLGSLLQVQQSKDPDGLRIFYYLVQASCYIVCLPSSQ